MPYDEELDARLSDLVAPLEPERKKMFGGTCFLLHGNMMAGVWREFLILRVGEEAAEKALSEPFVRPFDITGHPMRGWIMIEAAGLEGDELERRVALARDYAESLPPK